jgi:succinate dehydrogenase / fumarate reductase membrane anchor subunit
MESTNLSRSSHEEKGTRHWRWQRITALLLIPLSVWLILNLNNMIYSEYDRSLEWASVPFFGILLGLTILSLLFHGYLGLVVIIDDYIRGEWRKRVIRIAALLTSVTGLSAIVAVASLIIRN